MKNLRKLFPLFIFFTLIFSGCAHLEKSYDDPVGDIHTSENNETLLNKKPEFTDEENTAETLSSELKFSEPILDEALNYCEAAQDFWEKGELEQALEGLDKAYSLILRVDPSNDAKLMQQKEDLRFLISKRILEIYASRNIVVNGNYNEIPLEMNQHVEYELKRFTEGGERSFFIESYKRSGMYRPYIVKALVEAGLPTELSWLPLIESGFKVKALSKARALGLWQFIPSTGYKFGLNRNRYIDERLDPYQATHSAIAFMKELHSIFGDWTTVLAAYNCGEARVLRVIRNQNVNYLDNFWDLYERLPRETARYVPRFLATLRIVKNPEKYGLDKIKINEPLEFESIEVNRQVHLKDIAKAIGVPYDTMVLLNPKLRYNILPQDTYMLNVPLGRKPKLLSRIDHLSLSKIPEKKYSWHRVRRGETLSSIARRYRTNVRNIKRINRLKSSNYIVVGKRLKVPARNYVRKKPSRSASAKRHKKREFHRVKRGDSLWIIAKRYDTTVRRIQKLNGLSTTKLRIGQRLKIPGNYTQAKGKKQIYYVREGDTPYSIAKKHRMSLNTFLKINKISLKSKIYPGQAVSVE